MPSEALLSIIVWHRCYICIYIYIYTITLSQRLSRVSSISYSSNANPMNENSGYRPSKISAELAQNMEQTKWIMTTTIFQKQKQKTPQKNTELGHIYFWTIRIRCCCCMEHLSSTCCRRLCCTYYNCNAPCRPLKWSQDPDSA